MYIRLNEITNENIEKVKDTLTKLGVSFDILTHVEGDYFRELADTHLTIWESSNPNIKLNTDLRNTILDSLQGTFINNDGVIDEILLCELTNKDATRIINMQGNSSILE